VSEARTHPDPTSQAELAHARDLALRVERILGAGVQGRPVRPSDAPVLRACCSALGSLLAALAKEAEA
jgi:hypothetical protein